MSSSFICHLCQFHHTAIHIEMIKWLHMTIFSKTFCHLALNVERFHTPNPKLPLSCNSYIWVNNMVTKCVLLLIPSLLEAQPNLETITFEFHAQPKIQILMEFQTQIAKNTYVTSLSSRCKAGQHLSFLCNSHQLQQSFLATPIVMWHKQTLISRTTSKDTCWNPSKHH